MPQNSNSISYPTLIKATFLALKNLGGAGSNDEILDEVIKILNLNEEQINKQHTKRDGRSELDYRLGWARSRLKANGIILNARKAYWIIRPEYRDFAGFTDKEAEDIFAFKYNKKMVDTANDSEDDVAELEFEENDKNDAEDEKIKTEDIFNKNDFKVKMLNALKEMNPIDFEILSKVLLTELGFENVETTPGSHDGGIDGTADLILNSVVTFKVAFQCKRFSETSVGNGPIDSLEGAAKVSQAEKGIFITTSRFTAEAEKHAKALNITLIDGEKLVDLLMEKHIGCKDVKGYCLDNNYFKNLNK